MSDTAMCPQCRRTVKTHLTLFGDRVYNRHKMARLQDYDPIRRTPKELGAEIGRVPNPSAAPIWEIDCPMSGQVVE